MKKPNTVMLNDELSFVQSVVNHIDLLKEVMEGRIDTIKDKGVQKNLDYDISELETAINLLNVHLNNAHSLGVDIENVTIQ